MLQRLTPPSPFLIILLMIVSMCVSGVAEANNAPTTVDTIPDQTVYLPGSSITIDASPYFDDADGDVLTYTVSDSDLANQKIGISLTSDGKVTIWATFNTGTVTVRVHAADASAFVTQIFTVTVGANNAPTAVTIPDQTLDGRGFTGTVDVSNYFSDADGDTLTYSATSDDTTKVTVSVSTATLTLTAEAAGSATITVTATDIRGASGTQTFSVTVSADNLAPVAVGTIPDQLLQLGASKVTFNALQYFSDPNGDTLAASAASIHRSNDAIIDVTGYGNWDVDLVPKAAGTVTVTITASDPGGLSATQSFSVKVNKAPEANGTIPDGSITFGANGYSVDVSSYFTDANGDTLTYTANSSDTSKAAVSVSGSTVTVTAVAGGSATITVTATDIHSTSGTQSFTVVTTDSGPVTVGTISDVTLYVGGSTTDVALADYFDAVNKSALTYTVVSSATSAATVSVSGSTLTLTPVAAGTATITARALDSNSKFATQTFTATVVQPNRAPVTVGTIPDQTINLGGASITIDAAPYFSDADGDALTYTVSDSDLANQKIGISLTSDGKVTIGATLQTGTVTVRVHAADSSAFATQTFTVTVAPASRAPTANGTIPDSTKKAGHSAYSVDLSGYFTDADGDTLTYTAVSSDTAKATVSLSDATLSVTPVAEGTSTITATATDPSGAFATQSFTMTVTPANRTPTVTNTIPDQTIERTYSGSNVDTNVHIGLGDKFSDADGDALTYTATVQITSAGYLVFVDFRTGASTLTITAPQADTGGSGTTTVTVTATDTDNASVSQTFSVTTNIRPTAVGTIPTQTVSLNGGSATVSVQSYFSDADGDTLTYSASSSDTAKATVSMSGSDVTITGNAAGPATITITATDPIGLTAAQTIKVNVGNPPTTVGTMPDETSRVGWGNISVDVSSYFSEPDGQSLSYSASSSNTGVVTVSVSGSTVTATPAGNTGNSTITVTASDPSGLTATQTFTVYIEPGFADAIPGLSSGEQLLLGQLLTYDTIIFNELHNGSDDATDWLELRNVSNVEIPIDEWQLTIQTGRGSVVIPFPTGTVIPAGEVLLVTNTDNPVIKGEAVLPIVSEDFALPQTEFALILRSPTAFGDLAGNYFQDDRERSETAPTFRVDTVWYRSQTTVSGYRAEAWTENSDGRGTPGYHPRSLVADLNSDGVVNILDLVLVASQFGTSGATPADLNSDGTVDMEDLAWVANALRGVAAAPTAEQSTAGVVNNWLRLARQNAVGIVETSLPEGFSYERGILALEALARALTPESTALLANYPNPFNPETWIPYQLAKAADVVITIYATDGSVVRTLALGHQDVGRYHTRSQAAYWDGRNTLGETVASGVYFYTLTAGDFAATRKMLILK